MKKDYDRQQCIVKCIILVYFIFGIALSNFSCLQILSVLIILGFNTFVHHEVQNVT
jgi:hypothetical protein